VTVNLTRGQVAFTSPPPARPHHSTGEIVGVDVGAVHVATTSNGDHFDLPDLAPQYRKVAALSRRMAKSRTVAEREGRDWRTSNRYRKLRADHQAVHARIANIRTDWAHKTANRLVDTADMLVFEDLNLQSMTRKGGSRKKAMNRVMTRAAIGTLREYVTYKATLVGVDIVHVRAAFTSQRCNECGHIAKENRKSQAVFSCQRCEHTCNADINAARNIRDLAVGVWTNTSSAGSSRKTEKHGIRRASRKRPVTAMNRKPPTPALRG
jgi:transposase, IS605 OrfB family, central region